jgi:hypothetical protein
MPARAAGREAEIIFSPEFVASLPAVNNSADPFGPSNTFDC